ncbi:RagB/SusD family nutrient uptake outer membrane protein [Ferruginibacter yonginensis]|uniref:RagB/SusD family nutrient uptake outer membrane protein n=1 Tax=Ferruginibacter yonginensis TaxID=1310416 RepID=A0ABV8QV90_9BACT
MTHIFLKRLITLLVVVILFTQCKKSLLEIDPTIPIVTVDNYYKTESDAINAVNATYTPLSAIYSGAAWHLGDIMSDDADLGGGGGGDGAETAELDNFSLTSFNPIVNIMWAQCYYGVLRANLVIERVPQVPVMTPAIRTRSIGEGKFLRALYYFHLVRLFGDVPLYTTAITVAEASTIARSPRAAVYNQIIADLKDAETLLPNTYGANDKGRATAGAAKGLLANVYLTLGDKTNAATKAKEVIDNKALYGYDLWTDYADNFKLENENGKESVFEVQYRADGGTFTIYGVGTCINTFYGPRSQGIVPEGGYGFTVPTRNFVDQYEKTGPAYSTIIDKRRNRSIWIPGDTYNAYTQPASLIGSPNGFNVRKYFVPVENTTGDAGQWRSALNVPIMRYAEILLIYAEAAGPALGKPAADLIRARAGLAALPTGLSDAQWLAAIYKERRLELGFEMHRWYDLLRHPDPNYFVTVMQAAGKTNCAQKHRFMPIPQGERDKNPNLTQNTGY